MNRIERVFKAIRHQPGAGIPTGELTMERAFMEVCSNGRKPGRLSNH